MENRIKQIRQKTDGDFNSYPIGADAKYVDMSSLLDLEEELKIGGNHTVKIIDEKDTGITTIQQFYLTKELQQGDDLQDYTAYYVETVYNPGSEGTATYIDSQYGLITNEDGLIFNLNYNDSSQTYENLKTRIYKGFSTISSVQSANLLHEKNIIFYDKEQIQQGNGDNNETADTIITETIGGIL